MILLIHQIFSNTSTMVATTQQRKITYNKAVI